MNPTISVITVCYNAVDCIEKTILSVISQTYYNIEYIIIDGSSTDGTVDIIKKYADNITYWVSEPDKGIYDAMNKGMTKVTGGYINFMNAGDYFINNNVVADIVTSINKVYTDVVFGNVVNLIDGIYYEIKAFPFYAYPFVKHCMGFNHQCCFVKTGMAKRYPFDTKYRLAADYNMIMTIFRNKGTFTHVNMPVACYDTTGISRQKWFQHDKEIFSIERPNAQFANYFEVRKRAAIRYIKRFLKSIILRIDPKIIERRQTASNRMKRIDICENKNVIQ